MAIRDLFNEDGAQSITGGGSGGVGGSSVPKISITASQLLTFSSAVTQDLDLASEMTAKFIYDSDAQIGVIRPVDDGDLTFRSRSGESDSVYISFRGVGSKIGLDVEAAVTLPFEADGEDVYIDFNPAFEAMISGEYESETEEEEEEEPAVEEDEEDEEDIDWDVEEEDEAEVSEEEEDENELAF